MKRWDPPVARSEREERLLKLAGKSRKLLVFLRERRHEIFDAGFQAELESMYRGTDQGEEPQPPALMSVALLLQGYLQVSDAEAVRLSATDLCWRLVLGTLNRRGDEPAFSPGGLQQFRDRLSAWVTKRRPEEIEDAPLNRYIEALAQVKAQDVEPAPQGGVRLRQGVAEDRRISIEDAEMRHGRKSKSKRFDGYKQHVSTDLETDLVLACAVTPANRPEEEATPALAADMAHLGIVPDELQIDRAYLNSDLSEQVIERGGTVVCKPWKGNNSKPGFFGKKDFLINVRDGTITCPAGQVESFEPNEVVEFDPDVCGSCLLRAQCTRAASGRGRSVAMGDNEALQKKLRRLQTTRAGRAKLRERVGVEHQLAHIANRQGPRARYRTVRKNTFDLRRLAA